MTIFRRWTTTISAAASRPITRCSAKRWPFSPGMRFSPRPLAFCPGGQGGGALGGDRPLLIEECSRRSGAEGMVGGQVLDIQSENRRISLSELEAIHRAKRGPHHLFGSPRRPYRRLDEGAARSPHCLRGPFGTWPFRFRTISWMLRGSGDDRKTRRQRPGENKVTYPSLIGLEGPGSCSDNCGRGEKAAFPSLRNK